MRPLLAALLLPALVACGGSSEPAATPTEVVTVTQTAEPSEAPTPTPTPAPEPRLYPKGYPKVVKVASLPFQVKSWYEDEYDRAVAVAPGVWTPLPPGASMEDALATEAFDGFCGSIKAYGRKFRDGADLTSTCW